MKHFVLSAVTAVCLMTSTAKADFLPPNELWREDGQRAAGGLTEAQFNTVIDEAISFYEPFFKQTFNAKFVVNRLWSNSQVNASASQFFNSWTVNMFGGLARRPEATEDGFALVLCHEIGHHLAGYPFSGSWSADEGQSDYFATLSCARDLWKDQKAKNAKSRSVIAEYPKALCDKVWSDSDDQNLCYRSMLGGKSLGALLATLENSKVDFNTPDKRVVSKTSHAHPAGQCRMDTMIAGALCTQTFDAGVIPGKDLGWNRNTTEAEEASGRFTCLSQEFAIGSRSNCWFKSLL